MQQRAKHYKYRVIGHSLLLAMAMPLQASSGLKLTAQSSPAPQLNIDDSGKHLNFHGPDVGKVDFGFSFTEYATTFNLHLPFF